VCLKFHMGEDPRLLLVNPTGRGLLQRTFLEEMGDQRRSEVKLAANVVDINEGKVLRSTQRQGKENKGLAS
jgi:hypothetical protein